MPLSPENEERLKTVALSATALVIGGAVVKYIRREDKTLGFVYYVEKTGHTAVGMYRGASRQILQFAGLTTLDENGKKVFEPVNTDIPEDSVPDFEDIFPPEPEEKEE